MLPEHPTTDQVRQLIDLELALAAYFNNRAKLEISSWNIWKCGGCVIDAEPNTIAYEPPGGCPKWPCGPVADGRSAQLGIQILQAALEAHEKRQPVSIELTAEKPQK